MIYTVTFNPALDYAVCLPKFKEGELNRSSGEYITFGGKGINVSVVLNNLKVENTALGFLAGFTGKELEGSLIKKGIKTDFIYLKTGLTRINVKIKGESETEINANGPDIDTESLNELYRKLDALKEGDFLILSGSIPKSLPQDIYSILLKRIEGKGIDFIVDAEKELLLETLAFKPFLIKPNLAELETISGKKLNNDKKIINAAFELKTKGAKNVLVSLGKDGALLIDENGKTHKRQAPVDKLVNSVGSGDSMVAGFLKGYLESNDYDIALKFGIAAGSATAFSKTLATYDEITQMLKQ